MEISLADHREHEAIQQWIDQEQLPPQQEQQVFILQPSQAGEQLRASLAEPNSLEQWMSELLQANPA